MDKKPTRIHFVLSFISPLQVAQHVSGNHVPIFRSWRLCSVMATCWYCAVTMSSIIQICLSVWVHMFYVFLVYGKSTIFTFSTATPMLVTTQSRQENLSTPSVSFSSICNLVLLFSHYLWVFSQSVIFSMLCFMRIKVQVYLLNCSERRHWETACTVEFNCCSIIRIQTIQFCRLQITGGLWRIRRHRNN